MAAKKTVKPDGIQPQILQHLKTAQELQERSVELQEGMLSALSIIEWRTRVGKVKLVDEDSEGEDSDDEDEKPKPKRKSLTPTVVIRNLVDQFGWPQVMEAVSEVMNSNEENG